MKPNLRPSVASSLFLKVATVVCIGLSPACGLKWPEKAKEEQTAVVTCLKITSEPFTTLTSELQACVKTMNSLQGTDRELLERSAAESADGTFPDYHEFMTLGYHSAVGSSSPFPTILGFAECNPATRKFEIARLYTPTTREDLSAICRPAHSPLPTAPPTAPIFQCSESQNPSLAVLTSECATAYSKIETFDSSFIQMTHLQTHLGTEIMEIYSSQSPSLYALARCNPSTRQFELFSVSIHSSRQNFSLGGFTIRQRSDCSRK